MRVCIYTAIYGGYDELKEQPPQECDLLCFTDNPSLRADGWTVIHKPILPDFHPRMRAKYFKLMNHEVFPRKWYRRGYDYTIWMDASIQLKSKNFVLEMISKLNKYGMAMFVHPDRDCIYDEAMVCTQLNFVKYRGLPVIDQVTKYRSDGYPERNGLMASGIIARNMRIKKLETINKDWWKENMEWTYQDQISLPYVLWGHGHWYDRIELNLWDNHLFKVMPHLLDS